MKKLIFVLGLLIAGVSYSEEKSAVTEVVSSVVSGVVSTGKNVLKGVKDGVVNSITVFYDKKCSSIKIDNKELSSLTPDILFKDYTRSDGWDIFQQIIETTLNLEFQQSILL